MEISLENLYVDIGALILCLLIGDIIKQYSLNEWPLLYPQLNIDNIKASGPKQISNIDTV